jgi:hypothetical protein
MCTFLANFEFGVQKQVIVKAKLLEQNGGREQYFSGIALKLNTKLANSINNACAWQSRSKWLMEAPTLVIGLSASSALGKNNRMLVAGAASMDEAGGIQMGFDLRMQEKSPIIARSLLKDIVKNLARQACKNFVYDPVFTDSTWNAHIAFYLLNCSLPCTTAKNRREL